MTTRTTQADVARRRGSARFAARMALAVCVVVSVFAVTARADFVDSEVGARGLAMGGAFVGMEGDPSSLFWNPSAIHSDHHVQVEGMRTRLFDAVEGVTEDYLGITSQLTPTVAVGFAWTRTALEDLYHEDVLTGGLAWRTLSNRLSIGASVLFYGVDAPGYEALNDPNYLGAQWEPSFSVGALYRKDQLQIGFSAENLLRPEIQLISTSNDVESIGGRRRLGGSYLLQEIVWLSAEVRHHDVPAYVDSEWTYHVGAESWFQETLALRAGVDDGELTAGAGLLVRNVRTDLALITHERLGNTYRAAVSVRF